VEIKRRMQILIARSNKLKTIKIRVYPGSGSQMRRLLRR
jgi:hypothetical protein